MAQRPLRRRIDAVTADAATGTGLLLAALGSGGHEEGTGMQKRGSPGYAGSRLSQALPDSLLARVRLMFLVFACFGAVGVLPGLVTVQDSPPLTRLVTGCGLAALALIWVVRYRRGSTRWWELPIELSALLLIASGLPSLDRLGAVLYPSLFLRGSFGPPRQLVVSTVGYLASLLWMMRVGDQFTEAALSHLVNVPVIVIVMSLLRTVLARFERALVRERTLVHAGPALIAARDQSEVCGAAAQTALAVQEDEAMHRIAVLVATDIGLEVAATASGETAGSAAPVVPVLGDVLDARTFGQLCDDPDLVVVVMADGAHVRGAIVMSNAAVVRQEVRDSLQTLAVETTLALNAVELRLELDRRASYDPLTNLANRSVLTQRLGAERPSGTRPRTGDGEVGLLLLDLDGFKTVNDTFGHEAGDAVLVEVADRLRNCVRAGDTPVRLGGDEFAVVMGNLLDRREMVEVAERIRQAVQEPVPVSGHLVRVGASIGLAFGAEVDDPAQLVRQADIAMYAAKRSGRLSVAW